MRSASYITGAFVVAVVAANVGRGEDQMAWQPTIEAAQQIAARTNRLVLLHFWNQSCRPCLRLEQEVFSRPEVARALEPNFVMVKLNVDDAPGTAQLYGVSGIPTDVIILPDGRLVSHMQSPLSPHQYVAQMNQAAAGHRKLLQQSMAHASQAVAMAGQQPPQQVAGPNPATAPMDARLQGASVAPPAGNDRYAEYFPQQAATAQAGPPVQSTAQSLAAPVGANPATATRASYRPQPPQPPQLPPGTPPLALDGYCPVTLVERQQWAMGAAAYGAVHRGRTYLFLGPGEVKKFLAAPDQYAPVLSGNDPVKALENNLLVPGRREFGVYSDNRVYLFADQQSRQKFEQNPARYTAPALQASNPAPVTR